MFDFWSFMSIIHNKEKLYVIYKLMQMSWKGLVKVVRHIMF